MKSADIREAFLNYFEGHGHQRVASSSLIPGNDATLLFTNAGMVQFKECFLGTEDRGYKRASTSQRCVRAGGKHNDLENVGYTARHHTFFEMLGNFSFGDYFKREAIRYAWNFLTKELGLPEEKLWITVYKDDQEAEDIWLKEMGVSAERFSRLGDEDNFWSMGDTGPCGPCSEIFFDHGEEVFGGPPGSPDEDGDRYIEIWNLVFMQFNRAPDGSMTPLPRPSVDTGMGLERISAVMQGVHSNYEIDLFVQLLADAAKICGLTDASHTSLKVIADHIRSCAFLIIDGIAPDNEGRGYVLRRIIRRAIRHGNKLGVSEPFFHKLVASLARIMGDAYPELKQQQERIEQVLAAEEAQFAKTLEQGMRILEGDLEALSGSVISGDTAFKLYDTYGFPLDLTADIARERDLTVDEAGFETCMQAQRERARAAGQFAADYDQNLELDGETDFTGYFETQGNGEVLALLKEGELVSSLSAGEQGSIALSSTPFYAESGGQVGDNGELRSDKGAVFEVQDTQKLGAHHVHRGVMLSGQLSQNDALVANIDAPNRLATARNHSATHLLHEALRRELGTHVEQKGSLVDPQRLRFDFSHQNALSEEQLQRVEDAVNAEIRANTKVEVETLPIEEAKARGAQALFGEKYGDEVRVLTMGGGYSVELCGGTHVNRTGDISLMRIISESGTSSGIRRIEALTGELALQRLQSSEAQLNALASALKSSPSKVLDKALQLQSDLRTAEKELDRLKMKQASAAGADLADQTQEFNGVKVLAAALPGADPKSLRSTLDQLKSKLGSGIIFLASENNGRVALISGVTEDHQKQFSAGDLMKEVAPLLGGKGGGRPDMAQGSGSDATGIDSALQAVRDIVAGR